MKTHYSSFSFNFEIPLLDKKSLVWSLFKHYPEYDSNISDEMLIRTVILKIRSQYVQHRKSYLRFCVSLNSSLQRINYLESWFSRCVDSLHFLTSLPVFFSFPESEKDSIRKFIERFEVTALQVWFVSTHLKYQISCTRDLSKTDQPSVNNRSSNEEDEGDELEDAA